MRRFSFALSPVVKFPWLFFMFLFALGGVVGALLVNIHAILPSLVGVFICSLFYSMKRFSFILVTDRAIRVRMGVLAYGEIPFSSIASAGTVIHQGINGIGVKACGKGEVGMVTTTGEVARLELREQGTIRMFGLLKVRFTALRLSPEKQDEFLAMIGERIGGA